MVEYSPTESLERQCFEFTRSSKSGILLVGGENMANKEQQSSKNVKKVAKLTLKEKRALKREKRALKAGEIHI
jgi:hypothetical protein